MICSFVLQSDVLLGFTHIFFSSVKINIDFAQLAVTFVSSRMRLLNRKHSKSTFMRLISFQLTSISRNEMWSL